MVTQKLSTYSLMPLPRLATFQWAKSSYCERSAQDWSARSRSNSGCVRCSRSGRVEAVEALVSLILNGATCLITKTLDIVLRHLRHEDSPELLVLICVAFAEMANNEVFNKLARVIGLEARSMLSCRHFYENRTSEDAL